MICTCEYTTDWYGREAVMLDPKCPRHGTPDPEPALVEVDEGESSGGVVG